MYPAEAAVPPMTATTGLRAATRAIASCSTSPPAALPPGLSIRTITAFAAASSASAATRRERSSSAPMMPSTDTRAT
jgi:hypothetical protein